MTQNEYSLAMLRAQQDLGETAQVSSVEYCGKDYEISEKDYERGYYKDFEKYYCIECDRSSDRLYNIKSHVKTHQERTDFNCPVCLKPFSRNFDLNRHLKTHYQQKEYHCEDCNKMFSRLDALKRHQKMGLAAKKIHCKLTVEQENSRIASSNTTLQVKPPSSKRKSKKPARLDAAQIFNVSEIDSDSASRFRELFAISDPKMSSNTNAKRFDNTQGSQIYSQ